MNRRNFLSTLIGGLAATAAVRSFPFRVFSFPKEIKPLIYGRWEYRGDWLYFHPIPVSCYRELGYDIAYDQEMGVIQFFAKRPGNIRYSTEISLAEAKRPVSDALEGISFRRARSTARSSPESV